MNDKLIWLNYACWAFAGAVFVCFICGFFVDEATRWCFVILQFCFIIVELIIALAVVRITRK